MTVRTLHRLANPTVSDAMDAISDVHGCLDDLREEHRETTKTITGLVRSETYAKAIRVYQTALLTFAVPVLAWAVLEAVHVRDTVNALSAALPIQFAEVGRRLNVADTERHAIADRQETIAKGAHR